MCMVRSVRPLRRRHDEAQSVAHLVAGRDSSCTQEFVCSTVLPMSSCDAGIILQDCARRRLLPLVLAGGVGRERAGRPRQGTEVAQLPQLEPRLELERA